MKMSSLKFLLVKIFLPLLTKFLKKMNPFYNFVVHEAWEFKYPLPHHPLLKGPIIDKGLKNVAKSYCESKQIYV